MGQSSKETGLLALDSVHANHCLSDIQQILGSQGASGDLEEICSIHASDLSERACPVNDISGFESTVNSSKLLAACQKVDPVNECCSQICQNAILEAAKKLAMRNSRLMSSMPINTTLIENSSDVNNCRSIVLRWLSSRLDASSATEVLRRLSSCKVNGGSFRVTRHFEFLVDVYSQYVAFIEGLFIYFLVSGLILDHLTISMSVILVVSDHELES